MFLSVPFRLRQGGVTLVLMLVMGVVGCSPAEEGAIVPEPETSALRQTMDRLAAEAIASPGAVGLSVAVAQGDDLVEGGYGLAEVEHSIHADEQHVFRVGSVTKQFTAAGIMKLVESGAIDLDAPFTDYLADYPKPAALITVRHLLLHSSGIPSYTGQEGWARTIPLEFDHAGMLDFFEDLPLEFTPGSEYKYNNSGYYLLGIILEEQSGKSYADYLRDELVGPIDLARIEYDTNGAVILKRAQGYRFENDEILNDELIGMTQPGAAGAILATAGDLVRWQQALISGRVVSAESYTQMSTGQIETGSMGSYGFGLAVRDVSGHRMVGHAGGINGFNSMLMYFPDDDLHVAVVSNSSGYPATKLADALAREILGLPEPEPADQE